MIWFVILQAGLVGGTIGPSPMTLDQCLEFANQRTLEAEQVAASGINLKGEKISPELVDGIKQMSFTCVDQPERPKNGTTLKGQQHDK